MFGNSIAIIVYKLIKILTTNVFTKNEAYIANASGWAINPLESPEPRDTTTQATL